MMYLHEEKLDTFELEIGAQTDLDEWRHGESCLLDL